MHWDRLTGIALGLAVVGIVAHMRRASPQAPPSSAPAAQAPSPRPAPVRRPQPLATPLSGMPDPGLALALSPHANRAPTSRVAFGVQVEDTSFGGALVTYVYRQGPAELAGLRVGDRIERVDGQPVIDAGSFSAVLDQLTAGHPVQVELSRDGRRRSLPCEPRDPAEVFRIACDAGDEEGCASIGERLRTGRDVEADAGQAREPLRRACDGGVYWACINLGNMYRTGQGGAVDGDEAVRLFQRACDAEVSMGCFNLGIVYLQGDGVPQDPNLSHRYFQTACELGHPQACRYVQRPAEP